MISRWWLLLDAAYGFPSVLLYLALLGALLRSEEGLVRDAQRSFFRIIVVIGFVDLTVVLITTFALRLPLNPLTAPLVCHFDHPRVLGLLHWLAYALLTYQFFGSCLIALNRFTAIVTPTRHAQFWSRHGTKFIVGGFVLATVCSLDLVVREAHFDAIEVHNETVCVWTDDDGEPETANSVRYAATALTAAVLCLGLNGASICSFCRRRRLSSVRSRSAKRLESNLLLVAVAMFVCQTTAAAFQLYVNRLIARHDWPALSEAILYAPWLVDLSSLSSPWLLFLISANVRQMLGFGCGNKERSKSKSTNLALLQSTSNSNSNSDNGNGIATLGA